MFQRDEWAQVLIPKATRDDIRETARTHNLKIWEVVDRSLQSFKQR